MLPKGFEKVTTTMTLSPLGFALRIEGDSMESGKGISFAAGQLIVIEPQQKAKSSDYVIVQLESHPGLTLKQLIIHEGKQSFKPLNLRYPSLNFTPQTRIFGIVKELVMDF